MKAIETRYKGYRFRSRLEARWAVFFDALGIEWEYEKEGYESEDGTRYLPDFWLPRTDGGIFVEIKGAYPQFEDLRKAAIAVSATKSPVFIFSGEFEIAGLREVGFGESKRADWVGAVGVRLFPFDKEEDIPLCPRNDVDKVAIWVYPQTWSWLVQEKAFGVFDFHLDMTGNTIKEVRYGTLGVKARITASPLEFDHAGYGGQGRDYNHPQLMKAYEAARSARFEFGETPTIYPIPSPAP